MNKLIIILLAISLVVMTGCNSKEEPFSRYPSLSIPSYGTDDYIRSLSGPDLEVIYNAHLQT